MRAPQLRPLLRSTVTTLRELLPGRFWRSATFWLIIAVNIALIALYLWSRGGATTTVRIEAIGSEYRAFVDGKLVAERAFQTSGRGGIGLLLSQHYRLPGLPKPYGIDSVRVTDARTGELIFEDTFDGSASPLWQNTDTWSVKDGAFMTLARKPTTTGFQPWGDYILEAKLKNVTEAWVTVHAKDANNAVSLGIGQFRGFGSSSLSHIENGVTVDRIDNARLEVDRGQTLQSITAMLLRPYPTALLIIGGMIALAFVLRLPRLEEALRAAGRRVPEIAAGLVIGLAVGAFVLLWYLLYVLGDAMPHVPDSVLYVFQAKIFASFRVTADAPPVREGFSIFDPHMLQVVDGRWFSQYSFGHPIFLAVGQIFGVIWLVPPALGAASIAMTYWVGKHIYGVAVGLIAAILLFSSPFFLMTASNFMSHNTAAFTIIAALFLITLPTKRRLPAMFFAGVLLGLLFNNRPLTAVAFMPVLTGFMGYELLRAGPKRSRLFREDLALAAGALLLFGAYLLYNQMTTGDLTTSPYAAQGTFSGDNFGFSGRHSLTHGLQNEQELLSLMVLVANGWPLGIGLILAAVPFLLGTRHKWDYLLGASFLAIAAAPMFYTSSAIMHGPRYWYETMPFLILLTARGVQCLAVSGASAGDWLAGRLRKGPTMTSTGLTSFAAYSLVAALIAFSAYGWMFGQRETWAGRGVTAFTPPKASQLEGFNFTDDRLLDLADEMELEDALVLVKRCAQWWCYGSVFWTNSPDLDGDIVWAEQQRTSDDLTLLERYPDRDLYIADYTYASIARTTPAKIARLVEEQTALDQQIVTGAETTTPGERDAIRRQDLENVRETLEQYAAQNGSYPDTGGQIQSLCAYRTLDAACVLETSLTSLPNDPLGAPTRNGYWYQSDGTSFVLMALQEVQTDEPSSCPEGRTPDAGEVGRYCIQESLP